MHFWWNILHCQNKRLHIIFFHMKTKSKSTLHFKIQKFYHSLLVNLFISSGNSKPLGIVKSRHRIHGSRVQFYVFQNSKWRTILKQRWRQKAKLKDLGSGINVREFPNGSLRLRSGGEAVLEPPSFFVAAGRKGKAGKNGQSRKEGAEFCIGSFDFLSLRRLPYTQRRMKFPNLFSRYIIKAVLVCRNKFL